MGEKLTLVLHFPMYQLPLLKVLIKVGWTRFTVLVSPQITPLLVALWQVYQTFVEAAVVLKMI